MDGNPGGSGGAGTTNTQVDVDLGPHRGVQRVLIRPYQDSDAEAVADLFAELARAAQADPGITAAHVREWFSGAVVTDAAGDTRLVFADGALIAAALVALPAEDGARVDAFGGVLPAWRGHGLGGRLFGWQIERAREANRAAAPHARWEIDADAYSPETDAFRLFDRHGLAPVRYWYGMTAELPAVPPPDAPPVALPAAVRSVAFTDDRAEPLYAAYTDAMADHYDFEPRGFASWTETEIGGRLRGDLSRIALDGDAVAAYVTVSEGDDPDGVHVDLVGTRRPWRGRGLAAALLAEVLAAATADGKRRATLGVDAASPTRAVALYERAGFTVASSWVSYRMALD